MRGENKNCSCRELFDGMLDLPETVEPLLDLVESCAGILPPFTASFWRLSGMMRFCRRLMSMPDVGPVVARAFWLKAWAMNVAKRRGRQKAIVALARRLAVIDPPYRTPDREPSRG